MNMKIKLNSIKECSVCDGPGVRLVFFFQGCHIRCKGCHNPQTWDPENGIVYQIDDLVNLVKNYSGKKRITYSGGEPLEQYEALICLTKRLRELDDEIDIVLYTGNELKDVPNELLNLLDGIKTGRYVEELRTSTQAYIGSSNQKFLLLKGNGKDGD